MTVGPSKMCEHGPLGVRHHQAVRHHVGHRRRRGVVAFSKKRSCIEDPQIRGQIMPHTDKGMCMMEVGMESRGRGGGKHKVTLA